MGGYRQDHSATSAGSQWYAFEQGVRRMMEDIECWRDAPLWDPQSIAVATEDLVSVSRQGRRRKADGIVSWQPLPAQDQDGGGDRAADRRAAAQAQGDHVSWRVRRRASRAFAAFALRQEQGRHPDRQPDGGSAHHQGALSAACAAGFARDQSRGVRDGRLRRHRSRADAAEESSR